MSTTNYPEHEKLSAVREQSQAIGEFLDTSGYTLCEWHDEGAEFYPVHASIERVLAAYFDINLDEIETEKRQMLDALRKMNEGREVSERSVPGTPLYTRMTLGGREAARDARRQATGKRSVGESVGRRALR